MKGIYVLILSIRKNVALKIGALGYIPFRKGLYAYVGSAQNNLEKRVCRHLAVLKKTFWHIDYLLANRGVKVLKVFYKQARRPDECKIASELGKRGFSIEGFGSSDCKCKSHLFKIEDYAFLRETLYETNVSSRAWRLSDMAKTGWCVWITGLPGSGKSIVSEAFLKLLEKRGTHAQLLSSDALRKVLTPKPSYSLEEREIVYATLVYIAELLTHNGVNVVIDATGNLRSYRQAARERLPGFIEVYLECPLDVCVDREARRGNTYLAPKQVYAKAREGKASTVPGMGQPYERPLNPDATIDTTKCEPSECARRILQIVSRSEMGIK